MTAPEPRPSAEPSSPVRYDVADGVATIRLNRPESMNSLDIATKELLRETLLHAAADPEARCVVLTGSGRAFCTGQDLKEHIRLLESGSSDELFTTVEKHYNPIVTAIVGMEKPVVAAVNGVAAGAGASLALACDLRIVADTAGFNLAFANVALSCDTGSSYTLQRLVGPGEGAGAALLPTHAQGRRGVRAWGWPPRWSRRTSSTATVAGLAGRLAGGPTVALGAMRRSVAYAASHTFEEALELEGQMMTRTGATEDHRAAVAAFVAKEKPVFQGR